MDLLEGNRALGSHPVFGGLVLMGVLVKGAIVYGSAANDSSSVLIRRRQSPGFFQRERRMVAGDRIETVTPEVEFAPASSML